MGSNVMDEILFDNVAYYFMISDIMASRYR